MKFSSDFSKRAITEIEYYCGRGHFTLITVNERLALFDCELTFLTIDINARKTWFNKILK